MTAPARHLDRRRAERLHTLVQMRMQTYADHPSLRSEYEGLGQSLAHWLRHNGLAHTHDHLRFLGDPDGRNSQAARDLCNDWLQSGTLTHLGWHLQGMTVGNRLSYRSASRLALREADWLKRFVQSELEDLAQPAVPPHEEDAAEAQDEAA